jgi:hypothetical protein
MARFVDPLVVGRVIGEVVDLFVPSISMTVAYGPKDISNGCLLKPSATAAPPLVRISGRRNDLYTLVYIASCSWLIMCPCMSLHVRARRYTSMLPIDMHAHDYSIHDLMYGLQLAACVVAADHDGP